MGWSEISSDPHALLGLSCPGERAARSVGYIAAAASPSFKNLSGPATAAHVHLGPPGESRPDCDPALRALQAELAQLLQRSNRRQRPPPARAPRRRGVRERAHEPQPAGRDPRTDQGDSDVQERWRDDQRRHDDKLGLLDRVAIASHSSPPGTMLGFRTSQPTPPAMSPTGET
jgi:hypothetical protein